MCGIAGYVSNSQEADEVLVRMTRRLAHRGPDEEGFYRDRTVALGHRRLSIIDLSGSHQPMSSADGAITVAFNGEIYNFQALREELDLRGFRHRTQGDTEVLINAYRAYGTAMLEKLEGMFAFALWDRDNQRLFVARDHFGVKPLYYFWDGKTFVFGSELKAVMQHPAVTADLDLDAIGLFIECQYIPSPKTVYRNVHKLNAAHAMVLEKGDVRSWRYWTPDYSKKVDVDERTAVQELETELRNSVSAMLVADVPLGCFLSGGVDSSLVSAMVTDLSRRPVNTFHLGFHGSTPSNERTEAAAAARHIGSNHYELLMNPDDLLQSFEDWIDVFDEPFGDPAAVPTMYLARLARQHVTVVLTGEGADEVLAGYDNYAKRTREERVSRILGSRYSPLRHLVKYLPSQMKKDRLLRTIGEPVSRRYATIPNIFDRAVLPTLFTPAFLESQSTTIVDYAERFFDECNSPHYFEKIMHVDGQLWLVDDLLTKVDRATMASSLEARVPYLDHKFVEHCARLSPHWKRRGSVGKYLLKKVAERYLPRELVYRRKQGFTLPLSEWVSGPLRQRVAHAFTSLSSRGILRPEQLQMLLDQQLNGRRNHTGRIWSMLILEMWFGRYAPDFRL
jgi:asparagine synthase (glutamine-hydrolysing)